MDWYVGRHNSWLAWLVLTVVTAYIIYGIIQRRRQWMRLPPGPWGLPIIGTDRYF